MWYSRYPPCLYSLVKHTQVTCCELVSFYGFLIKGRMLFVYLWTCIFFGGGVGVGVFFLLLFYPSKKKNFYFHILFYYRKLRKTMINIKLNMYIKWMWYQNITYFKKNVFIILCWNKLSLINSVLGRIYRHFCKYFTHTSKLININIWSDDPL